jgi:mannose-6-phosphate isomerase
MEAMVNSDNVVRGGLTPKFKDTKTLVEMLKYEFKERKQNTGDEIEAHGSTRVVAYRTGYAEFMITKLTIGPNEEA